MESIQDAVYNWLTIKVVCDSRPADLAAVETERMFLSILEEDYNISHLSVERDENMYFVSFRREKEQKTLRFPKELIEVMINQINDAPDKYIIYPE